MIKKLIAGLGLALVVAMSFAAQTTLDTSGLSDAQVAELKAHAAKIVADTANATAGNTIAAVGANPGAAVTLAATWGNRQHLLPKGLPKRSVLLPGNSV